MKHYLIAGWGGYDDDRCEWNVVVYKDEDAAKEHLKILTTWVNEHREEIENASFSTDITCPYDPSFMNRGEGPEYRIVEIDVLNITKDELRGHYFVEAI